MLVVLLVLLVRTGAARYAALSAAVAVSALCGPVLATPDRLVEHVVTFPAGLAAVASPAGSPLPGGWIAALPGGRTVALALLVVAALAVLLARPPRDAAEAAAFAAAALTLATLLPPSTRVGWLVDPALLAGTAATLHRRGAPT